MKILDQYGLEIAIPLPNDTKRTSYVMTSRGKSRFVDEIHFPDTELRSSAQMLSELQKAEGREPCLSHSKTCIQETGAAHVTSQTSIKETCAGTLSISPSQAPFFTRRTIPTTERKWKVIPANSSYGGALSIAVSKMVTIMVRLHDQDERQSDAALHWGTIRPVLLIAFAKHGARDFSDEQWLRLIHEGSSKTRFEYCEDSKNSLACFRAIQGHSGGISSDPELMEYIRIPYNWKGYIFHRGCSFSIQSILENGLIPGEKESDKGRQTVFFTPLNPFGGDSDEEEPRDDCAAQFLGKVHCHSHWKRNQDAVYWIKLSRAQDQGLQFWQPKSHAIIVHGPVPGDRIVFERLSTPRPAPKVTLKSNGHSQLQLQQQQSICDDVSTSTRRLVRDPEPAVEKRPQFEIDLRVTGLSQDAILQDEEKMKEINEKLEKF